MAPISLRPRHSERSSRTFLALLCAALIAPGEAALLAQEPAKPAASTASGDTAEPAPVKLSADQLDSLVAPIALYPDPLLAQTLAASTYPLEIVQLQQWLAKNPKLKDKALADAVAKQPWDPSIQSMAAIPDLVKRLADDIQWTTQLGDAFLDQQADVMDACQRMRKKAQDKGALASNEQQKVETKVVEQKTVIVVEPTNPEVIYVPSYSPTVVYPPPVYPYPPVYYPPYYGGALISFGIGMAWGAAIWGGSCCGCGWGGGGNNVYINHNNNFNRNTNINRGEGGRGQGNNWQHNAQHRGGAPYSNKATANKYGGSARGDAGGSRGQGAGGRGASAGTMDRSAGGTGGRGASAGSMDRSAGGAGGGFGGGGGDRIGNQNISSGGSSRGGFGDGGGYSGSSARSSSSRGSSSMSSRGGGGGSRGGGGRGGGGRR